LKQINTFIVSQRSHWPYRSIWQYLLCKCMSVNEGSSIFGNGDQKSGNISTKYGDYSSHIKHLHPPGATDVAFLHLVW
jgi:hypothetical protein